MARRQQRIQRLIVSAARVGETKRLTANTAREAARKATALTGKGFRVAVIASDGMLKMACVPIRRDGDRMNIANCDVDPTFKRQIKGLAGARRR